MLRTIDYIRPFNQFCFYFQGSSKSMPWLADLVQSSESSLNALPLQCLCEFLLMEHNSIDKQPNKQKSIKSKVAGRLQDLLYGFIFSAMVLISYMQIIQTLKLPLLDGGIKKPLKISQNMKLRKIEVNSGAHFISLKSSLKFF